MSNWVIGMLPDEIQLVFFLNALKNWLPWQCSADKIPHWLPQSSNNGLLFIVSFRLPHLNTLQGVSRVCDPLGINEGLPQLSKGFALANRVMCHWKGGRA